MTHPRQHRIWMLALVPGGRYGRWWTAAAILAAGGLVYGIAAALTARNPSYTGRFPWSITLFFVGAVAYIVPMFHYIMSRTNLALDTLGPYLAEPDREAALHGAIERRPMSWVIRTAVVSIVLWLIQSRLLSGSWERMWDLAGAGYVPATLVFGPLFVWLTMNVAMSALLQNALRFRGLVQRLSIDIFEPRSYMPIGSMAVTSTLVVLGAMALLSVMWLDGPINWWTTLPALAVFTPLLALLLLLPVWPLHRRLVEQRNAAIDAAQQALRTHRASTDGGEQALAGQAAALSMRREVSRLPVWPFDVGAMTRLVSYAVIVPLTWAGAALIEMLVNVLLE